MEGCYYIYNKEIYLCTCVAPMGVHLIKVHSNGGVFFSIEEFNSKLNSDEIELYK